MCHSFPQSPLLGRRSRHRNCRDAWVGLPISLSSAVFLSLSLGDDLSASSCGLGTGQGGQAWHS